MQVTRCHDLWVQLTRKTCTERKNIHLYTCISENIGWAEYFGCPRNVIVGWAAAHPSPYVPAPLSFAIDSAVPMFVLLKYTKLLSTKQRR